NRVIHKKNQLLYDPIETRVREATSNNPAKNPERLRREIAEATNNYEHFLLILQTIWKRLESRGKDWRHAYKSLLMLLYLIVHGHDRVYKEMQVTSNKQTKIEPLRHFEYIDEADGKNYGELLRALATRVLEFIADEDYVKTCRGLAAKGEFPGFSSDGTVKSSLSAPP
ncbi:hypothetical protein AKO1_011462, partial [Acrasis kona]